MFLSQVPLELISSPKGSSSVHSGGDSRVPLGSCGGH